MSKTSLIHEVEKDMILSQLDLPKELSFVKYNLLYLVITIGGNHALLGR